MPNEFKYENQVWGEPITGERLSTNSHYTGEQVGGVLQDAKCEMVAHIVEDGIIRYGTVMQDAVEGSTPNVSGGSGKLITFNLDTSYYTAEEGMTWREWVNSEYNTEMGTCETCGNEYHCIAICSDGQVAQMSCCFDEEYVGEVICSTHFGEFNSETELRRWQEDGGDYGKWISADDVINPDHFYTNDY